MGLPQRIRGQESTFSLADTLTGQTQLTVALKTATHSYDIDTLEEGYLGEVANRFDDIYNGCSGDLEWDIQDPLTFEVMDRIVARCQDRLPQTLIFTLTVRYLFRDGRVRILTFKDLYWGTNEVNVAGRDEFVSSKMPWKCSAPPSIFAL